MADLATELSFGAVAGLGLAPGDPKYAALLREVLSGGATRFASVVDAAWPVRYVIPVRIPEDSDALGALLVQQERLSLVWRSPSGLNQSIWSALDESTTVYESVGHVSGEPWSLFRVEDAQKTWSFMVPPVSGRMITLTLRQNLSPWLGREPADARLEATKIMPAIVVDEPRQWVHRPGPAPQPAASPPRPTVETAPGYAAVRAPAPVVPVAAGRPKAQLRSTTLLGFLIGLAATLLVGGGWLVTQLAG